MKYWKTVARNAWADTVETLHLNSWIGFMAWVAGTLVVLSGLFFWGSEDAGRDEFLTRCFLAGATLGMIPFVFAWKFVGEPPRAFSRLREWTKELETAILETQKADKAIYGIAERYNEGLRLFKSGEDMKTWEDEFDLYMKKNFTAGFFLQLCAPLPPERGFTTVQRDDGPVKRINHPPPTDRERLRDKLHKISSLMPYADSHYRGDSHNSLNWKAATIRQYGLPEHREQPDTPA